jgi:hypothetical protein
MEVFLKCILQELRIEDLEWTRIFDDSLNPRLLAFEEKTLPEPRYKIGVVFQKEGQTNENEIFANNTTSAAFERFLGCIADKIQLKGWDKFAGGLDVKSNSTGTNSYYTNFKGYEIMFHVAPMLPYFPQDTQQVERKRHIGNDIVVIIFSETPKPFSPLNFRSQFNHVFIVVSPEGKSNNEYRISIVNKFGGQKNLFLFLFLFVSFKLLSILTPFLFV